MADTVEHKMDWITNGRERPESTTPICSCGWVSTPVPAGDNDPLEKMRVQWDGHMKPHMPSGRVTLH